MICTRRPGVLKFCCQKIKIDKNGELTIKTRGILGPTCVDEVNKLIEDLALVTEYRKTDEYYMEVQRTVKKEVEVKRG